MIKVPSYWVINLLADLFRAPNVPNNCNPIDFKEMFSHIPVRYAKPLNLNPTNPKPEKPKPLHPYQGNDILSQIALISRDIFHFHYR